METWMVDDEGKDILHNIYPLSFPSPSEFSGYPFKFSNNCRKGFFKRHNFFSEKVSKRKNFNTDNKEWNKKSIMFHLETRAFNISNINDPEWGVAPTVCVFNKDQVQMFSLTNTCYYC